MSLHGMIGNTEFIVDTSRGEAGQSGIYQRLHELPFAVAGTVVDL